MRSNHHRTANRADAASALTQSDFFVCAGGIVAGLCAGRALMLPRNGTAPRSVRLADWPPRLAFSLCPLKWCPCGRTWKCISGWRDFQWSQWHEALSCTLQSKCGLSCVSAFVTDKVAGLWYMPSCVGRALPGDNRLSPSMGGPVRRISVPVPYSIQAGQLPTKPQLPCRARFSP